MAAGSLFLFVLCLSVFSILIKKWEQAGHQPHHNGRKVHRH